MSAEVGGARGEICANQDAPNVARIATSDPHDHRINFHCAVPMALLYSALAYMVSIISSGSL